jgi:hypothetical protein
MQSDGHAETDLLRRLEEERYAILTVTSLAMLGFCAGAIMLTIITMLT